MLTNIFSLLFNLLVCFGYILIAIFILLLIQLISYQVFNFNLYKWLDYNLITRWL